VFAYPRHKWRSFRLTQLGQIFEILEDAEPRPKGREVLRFKYDKSLINICQTQLFYELFVSGIISKGFNFVRYV
jgi:hypothetical protein